jgi:hypothetical protein
MPTAAGKLKAGDRIRWTAQDQRAADQIGEVTIDYEVTERTGNDSNYAVWLKRVDGKPLGRLMSDRQRRNGTEFMLLEAAYKVDHGPFRLITNNERTEDSKLSYREGWWLLRRWALRERELVEANPAQRQVVDALLHRMDRYHSGDPDAFETI